MPTARRSVVCDLVSSSFDGLRLRPPRFRARAYLAAQSAAGAVWWVAVAVSPAVRGWTLGDWPAAWVAGPDLVLFVGGSAAAAMRGSALAAGVVTAWSTAVTLALGAQGLATGAAGWGVLLMAAATAGSAVSASVLRWGRVPTRWFFTGPFRFRPARAGPAARHLWHSLAQLVVFWSTLLVGLPLVLAWAERRLQVSWPALRSAPWEVAGATTFAAGSALGAWACATMAVRGLGTPLPAATARRLVVAGPYRAVRNPMAVAGALQTVGVGLWLGSWLVVTSAVLGAVVWDVFIRPVEEGDLRRRFGPAYEAYRREVRCWMPALPRRPPGGGP